MRLRMRGRDQSMAVVTTREAEKRLEQGEAEKLLGNENFRTEHYNVALSHYRSVGLEFAGAPLRMC